MSNVNRDEYDGYDSDNEEMHLKKNICAGLATGGAVSVLGPIIAVNTAVAVGTSGTGVAIASLSGAYQTTAVLAYLGGGTIASGGAGMAGGQALLCIFGPIGIAVAAGVAGFAFWKYSKRHERY